MADIALEDLYAAIRAAWAVDTCDPVDADEWSSANPSRGQCGPTALTIEIDLTRQQFADDEVIQKPRILRRPDGPPNRCAEQYLTTRKSLKEIREPVSDRGIVVRSRGE